MRLSAGASDASCSNWPRTGRTGRRARGRKARALLGYLCLHPGSSVARNRLAALLWDRVPDAAPLFPILWGLWLFYKVRSDLSRAQLLAGELLVLAERLGYHIVELPVRWVEDTDSRVKVVRDAVAAARRRIG